MNQHIAAPGPYWATICCNCHLFVPRDISKTDAAKITRLNVNMVHHESWETIYFRVRSSKVKVTMHKSSAGVSFWTLTSADFLVVIVDL